MATENKLKERWKRTEAQRVKNETLQSKPEAARERPPPLKAKSKSRSSKATAAGTTSKDGDPKTAKEVSQPNSRASSILSPPASLDSGYTPASPSSKPIQSLTSISANTSFTSTKSAPAALPNSAVEFKSQPGGGVILLSDLERQQVKIDQRVKQEKEAALKKREAERKRKRKEVEQKAANKKKRDDKARERHKQKLLHTAEQDGVQMTEEELEDKLDAIMADREVSTLDAKKII